MLDETPTAGKDRLSDELTKKVLAAPEHGYQPVRPQPRSEAQQAKTAKSHHRLDGDYKKVVK